MKTDYQHPNGERLIFLKTGEETNGELLEMEAVYNPESKPPPLHYHPYQEEKFEVLAGSFRVVIGEQEHQFEQGDKFTVPANTPHAMNNTSSEAGRLRWQIRPAMKSQEFFATMWGLAVDGETTVSGLPDFLQLMVIIQAYRDEFRAVKPPLIVQRILTAIFAPIGRWRCYQARYDKYSGSVRHPFSDDGD
jgi:quercetin dioxygenase-like cupin family protein